MLWHLLQFSSRIFLGGEINTYHIHIMILSSTTYILMNIHNVTQKYHLAFSVKGDQDVPQYPSTMHSREEIERDEKRE